MAAPRTIPMLPCADIDEILTFYTALGFAVAHRQLRPNPYLALTGHGFDLHYYGLESHDADASHSSCLVIVDDTGPIWEDLAAGLRTAYGRVPVTGLPRITRPRARKNAGGASGFSLVDPAGNWIRFMRATGPATASIDEALEDERSRLGETMRNAIVLADSKGDPAQAEKILRGAVSRAPVDDPSMDEAREFLRELEERTRAERPGVAR